MRNNMQTVLPQCNARCAGRYESVGGGYVCDSCDREEKCKASAYDGTMHAYGVMRRAYCRGRRHAERRCGLSAYGMQGNNGDDAASATASMSRRRRAALATASAAQVMLMYGMSTVCTM